MRALSLLGSWSCSCSAGGKHGVECLALEPNLALESRLSS